MKRAGRKLGPAIPAADKAIDTGSLEPLLSLFPVTAHDEIHRWFAAAITMRKFRSSDLDAGRKFVKAYVEFVHSVEEVYHPDAKSEGDVPYKGKAGGGI
ncbi:MAG: DUF6448 family protein [Acidobacteriia bacterium]|nr:DUF6448 family protein [Terriglobia bacterium]